MRAEPGPSITRLADAFDALSNAELEALLATREPGGWRLVPFEGVEDAARLFAAPYGSW